jgi:hypothetical protein
VTDRERTGPDQRITFLLVAMLAAGLLLIESGEIANLGYGYFAVLLAIPAALGALILNLADPGGHNSLKGCFLTPTLFLCAVAAIAYLLFDEGALCIVMILPLWIPAALAGALVTRHNARRRKGREGGRLLLAGWAAFPLVLFGIEAQSPPQWEYRQVVRETSIDADAATVWPLLVNIPAIAPHEGKANLTQDILGVPRPSRAQLVNRDGRMVRLAQWGPDVRFEEIVEENRPGHAIGWRFSFPDDSVQRHTDRHISPDGPLLKVESGGYELLPLANGKTRLRLTTRYRMRARLSFYLAWWGEVLLGNVQENVLTIIRDRAERAGMS